MRGVMQRRRGRGMSEEGGVEEEGENERGIKLAHQQPHELNNYLNTGPRRSGTQRLSDARVI
jgi:hypothetical protein